MTMRQYAFAALVAVAFVLGAFKLSVATFSGDDSPVRLIEAPRHAPNLNVAYQICNATQAGNYLAPPDGFYIDVAGTKSDLYCVTVRQGGAK